MKSAKPDKKSGLPREKLINKGAAALEDVELLQIVIGSGIQGADYKKIARTLHSVITDKGVENISMEDIQAIRGIGDAKSTVIFAALEFWKRKFTKPAAPIIDTPEKASLQLDSIRNKKQEYFVTLTLDGARRLINMHVVTVGTLTSSIVHPREVFALALADRAASIIIAHNHPSGSRDISEQDRKVTQIIKQAGELMGIPLDDHIIITDDSFISAMA